MGTLLGVFNLPWQVFKKNSTQIEKHAVMAEQLVRDLAIEGAICIEIKPTLSNSNQSYVQWCAKSDKDRNKNKVKITVTYDMGCHKRSSGSRYESSSRHSFIMGGIYKGIIFMLLCSKACRKFDAVDKRG